MVYAKDDNYEIGMPMPVYRKDHGKPHKGRYVAYVRVSTDKQDVENQVHAIKQYLNGGDFEVSWFKEKGASGANTNTKVPFKNRPVLREAIECCRKNNATLIVYSLSRFSRTMWETTHFFETEISRRKFKLIVVDNPMIDHRMIGFYANMNAIERENIRERTQKSMNRIKSIIAENGYYVSRQGRKIEKLGIHPLLKEAGQKGAMRNKLKANEFTKNIMPIILDMRDNREMGYREIARELNRRGEPTFKNGATWHASAISNLIKRHNIMAKNEKKGESK